MLKTKLRQAFRAGGIRCVVVKSWKFFLYLLRKTWLRLNSAYAEIGSGGLRLRCYPGALKLYWRDEELTRASGISTSIYKDGQWINSSRAVWKVKKVNDRQVVIKTYWWDLPVIQTWWLSVPDPEHYPSLRGTARRSRGGTEVVQLCSPLFENHPERSRRAISGDCHASLREARNDSEGTVPKIKWKIQMEVKKRFAFTQAKAGITVCDKYLRWLSSYEEGIFPKIRGWQDMMLWNPRSQCIGVRSYYKDGERLPATLFYFGQGIYDIKPQIQNTNPQIGARSLQACLSGLPQTGTYECFSGEFHIIDNEEIVDERIEFFRRQLLEQTYQHVIASEAKQSQGPA